MDFVIKDTSFQQYIEHGVTTFHPIRLGPTIISTHYNFIPLQFQAITNSTHYIQPPAIHLILPMFCKALIFIQGNAC